MLFARRKCGLLCTRAYVPRACVGQSELDLLYGLDKVQMILDSMLADGQLYESSTKALQPVALLQSLEN